MYQGPVPDIWLVTGARPDEETAVARAIAERLERAAHIDGHALWAQIVAGRVDPDGALEGEAERQHELVIRNQCLLARSYAEAGFTPVLNFAFTTLHQLDAYRNYLMGGRLRLVVAASEMGALGELEGAGLWLDPGNNAADAVAELALDRRDEAALR